MAITLILLKLALISALITSASDWTFKFRTGTIIKDFWRIVIIFEFV